MPEALADLNELRRPLERIGRESSNRRGSDERGEQVEAISAAAARLPADWVDTEQHPPPFVVAGMFPESEAGSLVSPGGLIKSTISLYESVHIILGRDLYGQRVDKPGAVLAVG